MFEEKMIEYAAPVLAGLKTAALFNYRFASEEDEVRQIAEMNDLLNCRGVFLRVMRRKKGASQVYLYRKAKLAVDLNRKGVWEFLARYGYHACSQEEALDRLEARLGELGEFPHEIGIFFGYPLADVIGFIENRGMNYRCVGFWKAYHNEQEARKSFALFEKCTEVYRRIYQQGQRSLLQMTVAAA